MTPITTVSLPTPFAVGAVNVYLIETEPLTLVDTGPLYAPALGALERALAERKHRIEDIELVLLTHQHFDHVGLAATLERAGARVAALDPLADYMLQLEDAARAEDRFAVNVMRSVGIPESVIEENARRAANSWRYGESIQDAERLHHGDVLTVGDRRLRVLHRPGHSPTDTVFLDEDAREAIVGDHLLAKISSNPVAHRPASGSLDPGDREPALVRYLESLALTRALDLDLVLAGHRKPIAHHRCLIDTRVKLHMTRAETILEIVRSGRNHVMGIAERLWSDIAPAETYLAVSEVLGHLDLLMRDGLAAARTTDGVTMFVAA